MHYKVSGSWPRNHNAILSIGSTAGLPPSLPSGSPRTKSSEVRERARGGARVTGAREKHESLGTRSLRTRSPTPACAETLSVFHRGTATRALATSELLPTNFFARGALRSRVRRATPSGGARDPGPPVQSPHSFHSAPGAALPRAPGLGAPLQTSGRLGSGAAEPGHPATDGQDSERARLGTPRAPVSPGRVRKRPAGRRAAFPAGERSGSPTSLSPGTFRAPSQKRK